MDFERQLGLTGNGDALPADDREQRLQQVDLQLIASGLPSAADGEGALVSSTRRAG